MSENYSSDADYLLIKLREKKADIHKFLASGQAKDHADYRQLCGNLRGLEFAEELILDLAKRREDADD